jgi:hypothetical protein
MARPTKAEKEAEKAKKLLENKENDLNHVNINELDELLEKDAENSFAFNDDEDDSVEDVIVDDSLNNNDASSNEINNGNSHKYEMPHSEVKSTPVELNDIPDDKSNDIPEDDFNPFAQEVEKKPYAQEFQKVVELDSNNVPLPEAVIPEPVKINVPIDDTIDSVSSNEAKPATPTEPTAPKKEVINPNLQDLSPTQKRKAAEQSADAMLLAYGKLVPIPFKKMSSFNMGKIQNMSLKGELDLNLVLMEDGTTVKSYCEGVNEVVDKTFEITPEMKDEIRPPLIEVLLENNLALTPTQRLIMAVGQQVVTMGLTAFQFMQQNKGALKQFKDFHNENKEQNRIMAKASEVVNQKIEVREKPIVEYRTEPVVEYRTSKPKPKEEVYEPTEDVSEDIPSEKTKKVNDYLGNDESITIDEIPNN